LYFLGVISAEEHFSAAKLKYYRSVAGCTVHTLFGIVEHSSLPVIGEIICFFGIAGDAVIVAVFPDVEKDADTAVPRGRVLLDISVNINVNGVAEHNEAYTLPDIAAAMAVGNWFDDIADNDDSEEIEVIDGYYSVNDTMADIIANEETQKLLKGWLMKNGNLTLASMLGAIAGMMGQARLVDMFARGSAMMGDVSPKDMAQVNRMLNKVKK